MLSQIMTAFARFCNHTSIKMLIHLIYAFAITPSPFLKVTKCRCLCLQQLKNTRKKNTSRNIKKMSKAWFKENIKGENFQQLYLKTHIILNFCFLRERQKNEKGRQNNKIIKNDEKGWIWIWKWKLLQCGLVAEREEYYDEYCFFLLLTLKRSAGWCRPYPVNGRFYDGKCRVATEIQRTVNFRISIFSFRFFWNYVFLFFHGQIRFTFVTVVVHLVIMGAFFEFMLLQLRCSQTADR